MSDPKPESVNKRWKPSPPDLIEKFIIGVDPLPPDEPERWFELEGGKYPGQAISTLGVIFTGRSYNQTGKCRGYDADGSYVWLSTRVSMAKTFFGPIPKYHHTIFKDGNTQNLRLSNLAYETKYELLDIESGTFDIGSPLPPDLPETWWKAPSDWPNVTVSTLGRIRNKNCILSPRPYAGYTGVTLSVKTTKTVVYVHQLVAFTFLGRRPSPKHDVSHIDDVSTNNVVSNIIWETHAENMQRAAKKLRLPIVARSTWGEEEYFTDSKPAAEFFGRNDRTIRKYCQKILSPPEIEGRIWTFEYTTTPKKKERMAAPKNRTDWVTVPNYPSYECLPEGHIRKIGNKYLLSPTPAANYNRIGLCNSSGRWMTIDFHVVICTTFHGPRPSPKHQAHHKNENKRDNRATNLEWTLENSALSNGQPCERLLEDGTWERFLSIAKAGRETGINECVIRNVLKGRSKRAGGFIWRESAIPNIIRDE